MASAFQEFLKARLRLAKLGRVAHTASAVAEFPSYPTPAQFSQLTSYRLMISKSSQGAYFQGIYGGADYEDFGDAVYAQNGNFLLRLTDIYAAAKTFSHSIPWEYAEPALFEVYSFGGAAYFGNQLLADKVPPSFWTTDGGEVFFQFVRVSEDGTEEQLLAEEWLTVELI